MPAIATLGRSLPVPGTALPEETSKAYAENALIKARAGVRATGALTLADHSGIEVDALDGGPGLYSARFGSPGLDDVGRTALLLERLRDVPTERAEQNAVVDQMWNDLVTDTPLAPPLPSPPGRLTMSYAPPEVAQTQDITPPKCEDPVCNRVRGPRG